MMLAILAAPIALAGLWYGWLRWSQARARREFEHWRAMRDLEIIAERAKADCEREKRPYPAHLRNLIRYLDRERSFEQWRRERDREILDGF
jgi:hypothetical protein